MGIVRFQFNNNNNIFRFPVFYAPQARVNKLSNSRLQQANIKVDHNLNNPGLTLPDGTFIEFDVSQGISVVQLKPPRLCVYSATLSATNTPLLWHKRLAHCSNQLLQAMNLINNNERLPPCDVCYRTKPKLHKLQTNPEYRTNIQKSGLTLPLTY